MTCLCVIPATPHRGTAKRGPSFHPSLPDLEPFSALSGCLLNPAWLRRWGMEKKKRGVSILSEEEEGSDKAESIQTFSEVLNHGRLLRTVSSSDRLLYPTGILEGEEASPPPMQATREAA